MFSHFKNHSLKNLIIDYNGNMDTYGIYIDESGTPDPKSYKYSPFFSLSGVMIDDKHHDKLEKSLDKLKEKYFRKKDYILHSADLRFHLKKSRHSLEEFSDDLRKILNDTYFFLLYVVVDNEKAYHMGWDSKKVCNITYKVLISNMLKFLVAKKMKGKIVAEASNVGRDIYLYNAFAHLIRHGVDRVGISHEIAKQHLTSLCYVTKLNNDPEAQLSDLFGVFGRLTIEIKRKIRKIESLNNFEKVISDLGNKRLFVGNSAKDQSKIKLYREINSFKILP